MWNNRQNQQNHSPYPNNSRSSGNYNNNSRSSDNYNHARSSDYYNHSRSSDNYNHSRSSDNYSHSRSSGSYNQRPGDVYNNPYPNTNRNSDRQFLEDVGLPPELAFRIDTVADNRLLQNEATRYTEKSSYQTTFYRDNLLGATVEYIEKNNILSYRKPQLEGSFNEESEPQPGTSTPPTPAKRKSDPSVKCVEYIVLAKKSKSSTGSIRDVRDRNSREEQRNVDTDLTDKREYFNSQTRKNPENVQLWKEFVEFQDQDCAGFIKSSLIGKKISILEKALRTNPKSCELHFDRLDLMNEISIPADLLTEWQKLVNANQEIETIWIERFKFLATQLQLFNIPSFLTEFEKAFQKLRTMLNPTIPEYQKPAKFHILISDLVLALCLTLKNAGYTEKSIAICQAQLEFDFNFPHKQMKMQNDKSGWKAIVKLFEIFWGLETLRFGETDYKQGWSKILETNPEIHKEKYESIGVSDAEVETFEDLFFETVNAEAEESSSTMRKDWALAKTWVMIECMRSKLYWTPWRERASAGEECSDTQRKIRTKEISNFLTYVPEESYPSALDQHAAYFRHVVNYLIVLSQEFLPKTHTVESILAPFASISLTDSTVFFSELNYWEKLMDLYYPNPKSTGVEIVPEGFQIPEFTLPSTSVILTPPKKLTIISPCNEAVEKQKRKLLEENEGKYYKVIRNIVTQSIEHLDAKFASLLVQMLFRFEQKSMFTRVEDHKTLMEFCKSLMQHEKLRSSIEAFGEIALLEYFGGRKKKSISTLIKTVNSSTKILKDADIESKPIEVFLSEHWETVTQITKLYRLVAEFHVKDEPSVALNILLSLGNHFDLISIPTSPPPVEESDPSLSSTVPSKHAILKAKRFFESVFNFLIPDDKKEEDVVEIDCEDKTAEVFAKWDGEHCLEFLGQKSNLIVEWTVAYSLFAYLNDDGFDSASEIYQKVMDKLENIEPLSRSNKYAPEVVIGHHIREQLYMSWCKLGALHVAQHPMQNAKFRTVFGKALKEFPSSPPLLLLYTTVESQCSVVGKLWRAMVNTVKQTSAQNICTLDWAPIFMCFGLAKQIDEIEQDSEIALDEFGIGGPAVPPDTIFYKMDAIFNAAENNILTQNCPLIWRIHLKHLAIRAKEGKDSKRAHSLFYEAIRRCPTNKALYMDAIAYFPEMMKEITDLMAQKELYVRLPIEELNVQLQFGSQVMEEGPPSKRFKRDS